MGIMGEMFGSKGMDLNNGQFLHVDIYVVSFN